MQALRDFLHKDFAHWLHRVRDAQSGEFCDRLGADPAQPKLLLVQARMGFSLAHLALLAKGETRATLTALAAPVIESLKLYRGENGLYGRRIGEAALAYDQSFVLLALATWHKLAPNEATWAAMEALFHAADQLREGQSGLYWDGAGALAQNPQMHFYEALLQAYEMSGDALWLSRAQDLRRRALAIFFDPSTGSLAEFQGQERREFGHHYEWAWLLLRETSFAPNPEVTEIAARLADFAAGFGHVGEGPMAGAVWDVGLPSGEITQASCLLWPQTEAIKYFAVTGRAEEAQALMGLIFKRWFGVSPFWVNQLGPKGEVLQPETFTRLFYHLVLAITEGARTGLWLGEIRA